MPPADSPTPTRYRALADDDLDSHPRDLTFRPAGVASPRVLDSGQLDHYNRHGYLLPLEVFDAHETAALRAYFDDLLARVLAAGDDQYSISTAHMKHGRIWDLLTDSRIVDPVADLLGDDVIGWGSHFFCKLPGDGKTVSWHQDASYWPMSPARTVTAWLAIDDADRDNACMRLLPGSHLHGHLPYRESAAHEHNVLNQTVADAEARFGPAVDVELRAGQMSLHSDLLLHGSGANDSDRRRCGLTLRYCAAEVRAWMGWNGKGVVVRGADADGHWGNPGRPDTDGPESDR